MSLAGLMAEDDEQELDYEPSPEKQPESARCGEEIASCGENGAAIMTAFAIHDYICTGRKRRR